MVTIMKLIALVTILANIIGFVHIAPEPQILDGPGMVYVDSNYRTVFANTFIGDDEEKEEQFWYWAVAYLGSGEEGKANRDVYIEKLFSTLSEEDIEQIGHFDYEGDNWYLVIPRYFDNNVIRINGDEDSEEYIDNGNAFTIKCGTDISLCCIGGNEPEFLLQTDENGKLIYSDNIWDMTEYEE